MSSALDNLARVARALEPIHDYPFVFAGASILPLLVTDPAGPPLRPTLDVDVAVLVAGSLGRWEHLRSRLREDCGFTERAPASGKGRQCLFYLEQLEVDVMAVDWPAGPCPSRILELGVQFPEPHFLEGNLRIETLSAANFLAAKLQAFSDRGRSDPLGSKDFIDIVTLFDGRPELFEDFSAAIPEIGQFITDGMRRLLSVYGARDFIEDEIREPIRAQKALNLMNAMAGYWPR